MELDETSWVGATVSFVKVAGRSSHPEIPEIVSFASLPSVGFYCTVHPSVYILFILVIRVIVIHQTGRSLGCKMMVTEKPLRVGTR